MKILKPGIDLDIFFSRLRKAKHCALLLDYNGTLAPFRDKPEQAFPYPGISPLLDAIMQDGRTRVILISGRWTQDLLPLTGLKRTPEIWGSHGWERLFPDGRYEAATPDETALRGLTEADTWIEEIMALGESRGFLFCAPAQGHEAHGRAVGGHAGDREADHLRIV